MKGGANTNKPVVAKVVIDELTPACNAIDSID